MSSRTLEDPFPSDDTAITDAHAFADLEDAETPAPVIVAGRVDRTGEHVFQPPPLPPEATTLPFDALSVKRVVEVHVDKGDGSVHLLADVRGQLRPVAIPGGMFSLAFNDASFIVGLLRMITGYRFERSSQRSDAHAEIWVRADYPQLNAR